MKLPSPSHLLFSAKCFVAAMLALYIAMASGLPRPFWAMMTAYIVANPFAGAVRSKAIYRVFGTILGSLFTILIVPQLANAPELLSSAIALWVGLCLYISLLDRTPRSYVFMLAGYTAGLIGFPAVSDPTSIFDTGLARVEEICIGILSASVVHSVVFPQGIGPGILNRLDAAIRDVRSWMYDALQPTPGSVSALGSARLSLAAEITDLRVMSTHLPFDTSNLRLTSGLVHRLADNITKMLALLLAVEDRLNTLQHLSPASLTPRWQKLLNDVAAWLQEENSEAAQRLTVFQKELELLTPKFSAASSWSDILCLNLIRRLSKLITIYAEVLELRSQITLAMQGGTTSTQEHANTSVLHRDHGMAFRSAFAAVVAISVCSAFWILTAWPAGAAAPMMAGVFCSFFATQDDPVPAIKMFIKYTLLSVPVAMLYIISIIPAIHSFEMLLLCMAPLFIVAGSYIPHPATGGKALAFLIGVAGALSLQDTGTLEITSFLNGLLAQLFGFVTAGVITSLIRTVSNDWMISRMMQTVHREFVEMSHLSAPPLRDIAIRTVDRIGLLMPRLSKRHPNPDERNHTIHHLRELRAGIHITQLRGMNAELKMNGILLSPLFTSIGNHFTNPDNTTANALNYQIDQTLREICASDSKSIHLAAISALTSMRRDLFPDARTYNPFLKEKIA
ncbi:MAG: FUSC family protein [Burkholderiaceae bacterium]|nr:FUSC family protein [Burkholderiaceae bacterium]